MIDLVGTIEQVLDKQHAVMDDHENKVAEVIECLHELQPEAKAAVSVAHSTDPSHHLHRGLNDVKSNLRLVKEEVDALKPGSQPRQLPLTAVRGADRQYKDTPISSIRTHLSDVIHDILSSHSEDKDLQDKKDTLCKSLFQVSLQIKHLLQNQPSKLNRWRVSRMKLPKIYVHTFDGNILS